MFSPKSIAIIGASDDVQKIRGRVLANLIGAGFKGAVYPIHPKNEVIQGLRAYPSVRDVPDKIDLAIVVLAAGNVLAALEECADAGIRNAIVYASGYSDAGDDEAQAQLGELARRTGMRILGPNTVGYFNEPKGIAATFSPVVSARIAGMANAPRLDYGKAIDIVCQSGGLGFALYSRAIAEGIAVRNVITTGNEADCETLEIVEYLLSDGQTNAILLFVEGFAKPERLEPVAQLAAEKSVPLIVAKLGRSDAGQRAAVSHTAHLTGSDVVCEAVFNRHGIIRVADPSTMIAIAATVTRTPIPGRNRNRVAIVTTSGGSGGWSADILSGEGLAVPEPSAACKARLEEILPAFGSAANPIDVTASVLEDGGTGLAQCLDEIAKSGEFDAALVILSMAAARRIEIMQSMLEPILRDTKIPVVFHSPGIPSEDNLTRLHKIGGVELPLREAADTIFAICQYGNFLADKRDIQASSSQARPHDAIIDDSGLLKLLTNMAGDPGARADLIGVLKRYGIDTPPEAVVTSAEAARSTAEKIGFPVVLKVESADIPHKTDAGCVVLNVENGDDCAKAYARIIDNAKKANPSAKIAGVLIQKMMPRGIEMVVGMTRDPDFGPMLALGFGGIYVEILKDSVVAPASLGHADARRMIAGLKGHEILLGARGQRAADVEALARVLVGLSHLITDTAGALSEVDLNPVIVYPAGGGAAAVDFLFVAGGS